MIQDDLQINTYYRRDTASNTKEKLMYKIIKRSVDIFLCSIAFIIFTPIIIIACLCVVIESKGSPIFKQERLGLNGKSFLIYKIRSMRMDAEAVSGPKWAEENDPRVTRVGRFIRRTRIDEMPQIVNILKGEMSMVGPRPEREVFYKIYEEEEKLDYRQRLRVKQGLTGYAQVYGGYELNPAKKLELDNKYIEKRSLIVDFIIILKTVNVLFSGDGAR